jgi:hypothetical protein
VGHTKSAARSPRRRAGMRKRTTRHRSVRHAAPVRVVSTPPASPVRSRQRNKPSPLSGRTAASAQAAVPPEPNKETPVQCSRPSPSSATTPSRSSLCS